MFVVQREESKCAHERQQDDRHRGTAQRIGQSLELPLGVHAGEVSPRRRLDAEEAGELGVAVLADLEHEQLLFNATLLDQRILQLGGAAVMMIQQDTSVGLLYFEIAALDFFLKTVDAVGASEMRALVGSEQFASSLVARKAAYVATRTA